MFHRRSIISIFLFLILVLSACNSSSVRTDEIVEDGLVINSVSIGLGGNENLDTTVVSYNFNLWNRTSKPIVVKTVEPILTNDLRNRMIDNNIKLEIDKQINGNSSEALSGTFKLNTKGLDKKGIMDLEINVKEFKITSDQVIGMNKVNN